MAVDNFEVYAERYHRERRNIGKVKNDLIVLRTEIDRLQALVVRGDEKILAIQRAVRDEASKVKARWVLDREV